MRSAPLGPCGGGSGTSGGGSGGGGSGGGGGASRASAAAGKRVFAAQNCGSCHTFRPAGTTGKTGPDLDRLPQYAKQAGEPLGGFVRHSIVEPNAYVQKGYPPNVMPQDFGDKLSDQELDALVRFLVSGSTS